MDTADVPGARDKARHQPVREVLEVVSFRERIECPRGKDARADENGRAGFAAQILSLNDPVLAGRLDAFREAQTESVPDTVED